MNTRNTLPDYRDTAKLIQSQLEMYHKQLQKQILKDETDFEEAEYLVKCFVFKKQFHTACPNEYDKIYNTN